MFVLIFSTVLSDTFLILRRIQRDIIIMCTGLHVKYRYSCQTLTKLEFSRQTFFLIFKYQIMKIRPVGFELFPQTNGQADGHDRGDIRFLHFGESAYKSHEYTKIFLFQCSSEHFTRKRTYVLCLTATQI
jgi:hypothetical protein